jgi:dihydroorotase
MIAVACAVYRDGLPFMLDLRITRPDDWHVHLRDGEALAHTAPAMARYFGRAIAMPNLVPPVTNTEQAIAYAARIDAAQAGCPRRFQPLPVLYLTDSTSPAEIATAKASGAVFAAKLYPAGATTNSANGVTDLQHIHPVLEAMQEHDLPLLIHGEVTDSGIDVFDREKVFIDRHLQAIVLNFPALRVVFEHITTRDAAAFVREAPSTVAATITAHHLLYNRNHMLAGNIRPHFYCLPILKRNIHQEALIAAAVSGDPKFFLGTDSAPHARHKKETACGCAGCYTAHAAIELYAEAFEAAGALDKLEAFASFHGADFYRLPRNTDTIVLRKQPWQVPEQLEFGGETLVPLRAGEHISWQVVAG